MRRRLKIGILAVTIFGVTWTMALWFSTARFQRPTTEPEPLTQEDMRLMEDIVVRDDTTVGEVTWLINDAASSNASRMRLAYGSGAAAFQIVYDKIPTGPSDGPWYEIMVAMAEIPELKKRTDWPAFRGWKGIPVWWDGQEFGTRGPDGRWIDATTPNDVRGAVELHRNPGLRLLIVTHSSKDVLFLPIMRFWRELALHGVEDWVLVSTNQ